MNIEDGWNWEEWGPAAEALGLKYFSNPDYTGMEGHIGGRPVTVLHPNGTNTAWVHLRLPQRTRKHSEVLFWSREAWDARPSAVKRHLGEVMEVGDEDFDEKFVASAGRDAKAFAEKILARR